MTKAEETTVAEKKTVKKSAGKAEPKRTLEELFAELEAVTAELEVQ